MTAFQAVAAGGMSITAGPDGNLWFIQGYPKNKIGRITVEGTVTEFSIPTGKSLPESITAGSDGNLWFTESVGNKIGRITPQGAITEFAIPTAESGPACITTGPDGNLWFTENYVDKIGRITTDGTITEFATPVTKGRLHSITAGPDGNLWFTKGHATIGKITTTGTVTEFSVPTTMGSTNFIIRGAEELPTKESIEAFQKLPNPHSIAAGPDGNIWFTERGANKIGRITTSGIITEFTIPTANSVPYGIVSGPDGNLWFTEYSGNKIGRITTSGIITEFTIPTAKCRPDSITLGPDGNLWFTEEYGNKIGKITTTGMITEFTRMTAAEHTEVRQAYPCAEVVETLCKGITPGGGRIIKCLREHEKDLSQRCRKIIFIPDEARLMVRIQELHAAVVTNDAKTWYTMTIPNIRENMSLEDFKKDMRMDQSKDDLSKEKMRFDFEKICYPCVVIGGISSDMLRCVLSVVAESGGRKDRISEMWEYVGGEWYWGIFGEWGCEEQ